MNIKKKLFSISLIAFSSLLVLTMPQINNNGKANIKAYDKNLTKGIQPPDTFSFDKAYKTSTVQYANLNYQKVHNGNFKENANSWSGPTYTGYWGWGFNNPFDAIQIMKDSGFKNFTFGFLNSISDEGILKNIGANYLDQIQEIHRMGGNVTISFGGDTSGVSFFNNAPSSSVMYSKLKNICLGYHVNSLDFDIEGSHQLNDQESKALITALIKLREFLKNNLKEDLHIRFTPEYFGNVTFINNVTKEWGTNNLIWNDMGFTFSDVNLTSSNNSQDENLIESEVDRDIESLKYCDDYKSMSDDQIMHSIGITGAIDRNYEFPFSAIKSFFSTKKSKQLGLLGIWSISNDHSSTSTIDPAHQNPVETSDFEFTNYIQTKFENNNFQYTPNTYNQIPSPVQNLIVYSKNKQYITLNWKNDLSAKYFNLIDLDTNKVIVSVDRNFASLSIREHPEYKGKNIFNLGVQAINSRGKSKIAQIKNINISNTINSQLEYWDANIKYNNTQINSSTYIPLVEYIYYNGNIYQDVNRTSEGISSNSLPPNQNIKDWKLVGKATDSKFGLSSTKIQDLKLFQWDQSVSEISKLITVNYNENQTILPNKIPYFIKL